MQRFPQFAIQSCWEGQNTERRFNHGLLINKFMCFCSNTYVAFSNDISEMLRPEIVARPMLQSTLSAKGMETVTDSCRSRLAMTRFDRHRYRA